MDADLNDRQACIVRHLLTRHDVSCNAAGDLLARAGLLRKASSYASNLCLPGFAVLRALQRRGLVMQYLSSRDQWAVKLYSLSREGRLVAETLKGKP